MYIHTKIKNASPSGIMLISTKIFASHTSSYVGDQTIDNHSLLEDQLLPRCFHVDSGLKDVRPKHQLQD